MAGPLLLNAVRDHLVAQAVVRKPSVAGGLPPLWLEPRLGTPAPGEGNNPVEVGSTIVLAAYQTGGIASPPYESFRRRDIVEFRLRSSTAPVALTTEQALRANLADKRNWTMGGLQVIESSEWRALSRLGSDEQGFEFLVAYLFETFA